MGYSPGTYHGERRMRAGGMTIDGICLQDLIAAEKVVSAEKIAGHVTVLSTRSSPTLQDSNWTSEYNRRRGSEICSGR